MSACGICATMGRLIPRPLAARPNTPMRALSAGDGRMDDGLVQSFEPLVVEEDYFCVYVPPAGDSNGDCTTSSSCSNSKPVVSEKVSSKPHKRYTCKELIGSGAYGKVLRAYDHEDESDVALKRCRGAFANSVACLRSVREVVIHKSLSHPNIVRLRGAFVLETCLHVVTDLCTMDLSVALQSTRPGRRLEVSQVGTLSSDLLLGLAYIHLRGVLHRDLKPENCLITTNQVLQICDFGLARLEGPTAAFQNPANRHQARGRAVPPPQRHRFLAGFWQRAPQTGHVQSRWYRSPEVILQDPQASAAMDMWSAGCILAELQQVCDKSVHIRERGPLFRGGGCALSPRYGSRKVATDQLCRILEVCEAPGSEEPWAQSLSGRSRAYLSRCGSGRWAMGLGQRLPAASSAWLELIVGLLQVVPWRRLTAVQALQTSVFDRLRCEVPRATRLEQLAFGKGGRLSKALALKLLEKEDF